MPDWLQPFLTADGWIALVTLTALEVVLGIDNIVFIAILCDRLPERQRAKARTIGLALAMIARIALLGAIVWVIGLAKVSLFTVPFLTEVVHAHDGEPERTVPMSISGKDLVLLAGGLFLLVKSTLEIHKQVESSHHDEKAPSNRGFAGVLTQIVLIDMVFSLDSVITAVGMVGEDMIAVMVAAVVVAVAVMMLFAGPVSRFISNHPTMKMLALAILFMIGALLVADGLGRHFPRGYVYFAMAFAFGIELLNMKARANAARRRAKSVA